MPKHHIDGAGNLKSRFLLHTVSRSYSMASESIDLLECQHQPGINSRGSLHTFPIISITFVRRFLPCWASHIYLSIRLDRREVVVTCHMLPSLVHCSDTFHERFWMEDVIQYEGRILEIVSAQRATKFTCFF